MIGNKMQELVVTFFKELREKLNNFKKVILDTKFKEALKLSGEIANESKLSLNCYIINISNVLQNQLSIKKEK